MRVTPVSERCDGVAAGVGASERRCFKPGAGEIESFKDCPECPEMVVLPAGEFMMGSNEYFDEKPVHELRSAGLLQWPSSR